MKFLNFFANSFPIWILSFSLLCLFYPQLIGWYSTQWISLSLGGIMLSMGMTLRFSDFTRVVKVPFPILVGIFLQFTIMPLSGYVLGNTMLADYPYFSAGLILVASCPGGTASNLLTFLAGADLALSVTMTVLSTFLSIILTPFLSTILIGDRVDVSFWGLFLSTLQVVLVPVILGILLSRFSQYSNDPNSVLHKPIEIFKNLIRFLSLLGPSISVILITLIVSKVIAESSSVILESGWKILSVVFFLHISGFVFGYWIAYKITKNRIISRTVSIEVGMQNSGLGVVLANSNFANPMVMVPPAVSSLMHSLIASILAYYWRKKRVNPITSTEELS